jgi:hypothetical protein
MTRDHVFVYGEGNLWTQQGEVEGLKCISIKRTSATMPVGSQPIEWKKQYTVSECDCLLVFKTLEGARVLQDEINGLISEWSKQLSQPVEYPPKEAQ